MKKYDILMATTAILSCAVLAESAVARDEIACPTGSETGATCWKCGDDCTAKLYNGKMKVTGTGDMYDWEQKSVSGKPSWAPDAPWSDRRTEFTSIEIGDGITKVGDSAFALSYNVTSIKLGNTIESIERSAFHSSSASELIIPASVKNIGLASFSSGYNRNNAPTSVIFEEGSQLERLDNWAFAQTQASSISLPDSVKYIGQGVFEQATKLTKVVLPNNPNLVLGDEIFAGTYITDVILPAGFSGASSAFRNMQSPVNVYCSQAAIDAGKCNSSYLYKSPLTVTHYERDENGNFVVYNNDGSIKGVYANGKNVFSDTIVDYYETTDSETGQVTRYNGRGQFLSSSWQDAAGSVYNFDKNGNLKGMTKRGPFTIPEADAATKKGPVNTLTITW